MSEKIQLCQTNFTRTATKVDRCYHRLHDCRKISSRSSTIIDVLLAEVIVRFEINFELQTSSEMVVELDTENSELVIK